MFILNLTYVKPISEVEAFLSAHNAYLDANYRAKKFICSGRKVPRTGGIILCNCASKEEAEQILAQDPFFQEKIAQYEVQEFVASKSLDSFKAIMEETAP